MAYLEREYFDKRMNEVLERIEDIDERLKLAERNGNNTERYLTTKDVCFRLKISSQTLYRKCKEGKIKFHRIHNRKEFRREDIAEYLERSKVKQ